VLFFAIFSAFVRCALFVRGFVWFAYDYNTIVVKKQSITGTNHNLQLHNNQMSMTVVGKNVLTASHTKYCVIRDFSTYVPLFVGVWDLC
jgi:hypothetical protein